MTKDEMDPAAPVEPDESDDDWATATDLFHLDVWISRHPAPAEPESTRGASDD